MAAATSPQQLSLLDLERQREPSLSDRERVACIADRLIEELGLSPPISLQVVASMRDITVIETAEMAQSGLLAPTGAHLRMQLNASDSPRRRRFTGFHEVGHTFQPSYREQTLFRCSPAAAGASRSTDPEALADVAAAALLLPARHFGPLLIDSPFELSSVIELADLFDASITATAYRFAALWPEPALVLTLALGKRKADRDDPSVEPKLRVVSSWPNAHWRGGYVPRNKSAIDGGALDRALLGELIHERSTLAELGLIGPEPLDLTARRFDYRSGQELRHQVIAIYRHPEAV